MLSRALASLSRVGLSRSSLAVRGFGASALISKTASVKAASVKTAATVKAKRPAAKKSDKPKRTTAASKPKRAAAAKPKRVAAKKPKAGPTKKDVHEKVINSKKPIVAPPKQAPTAYSLFVRDTWKDVRRDAGEDQPAVFAAVSREAAGAWRALSDAKKQAYRKQHDDLRAQHAQDVRKWWAAVDRTQVALENQRRRRHNRRVAQELVAGSRLPLLKDPLAPKRPLSAFVFFMKERITGSTGSVKDASRALGAEWRSLPESARAPYVAAAQAEAGAYKAAAAKYASSN
ncbi:hypothetical protein GGI13_000274 [Coemansia sp. RSA 455]|nr:hypothetical protein IW146_002984 [Coemansia sp. RSA 922]KAJ2258951.1 hypothetical protein GGI13_000274 [Coemansia sp. RSA 455]